MLLSGHIIIRNGVRYDYPFREVVRSAMPILDELVILCEPTGDGTESWCEELAGVFGRERTQILYEPWWNKEREHACLADATNRCIERCRGEYHLQMQADDCFHEDEIPLVRQAVEERCCDWIAFGIRNLWTGMDVEYVGPHLTVEARWCARRSLYPYFKSTHDAFALGTDETVLSRLRGELRGLQLNRKVDLINYGMVRRPAAFVRKHADMAALYGLPPEACTVEALQTGRLDWTKCSTYNAVDYQPFGGRHPAVMREWIESRRAETDGWIVRAE